MHIQLLIRANATTARHVKNSMVVTHHQAARASIKSESQKSCQINTLQHPTLATQPRVWQKAVD